MNSTHIDVKPHVSPHIESTYTAQEIADQHSVKAVTVRTRWFDWLLKVAPSELLKVDKAYTELANALFAEFAKVDPKERHAWVADAKKRYSREWSSVGVIDCEVMPDNVGGTLALLQTNNSALHKIIELELATAQDFAGQLNATDSDFSKAEIESFIAAGTRKAIQQFQAEEIARAQVLNELRKQRLQGGQS